MSAREATGSGSQARGGTGNHSARRGSGNQREPEGTGRRFDSLDAFIVRALSEPELTYLVPGLAPDRGRLLVVAPPNAGKTWLALAIAKAACGAGRKVFLIEEEGSRRKLGERLQSMAFPPESAFFVSHLGGLKIDDREDRQWLAQQLREADSPVIVLDPLTSLWSGDENDTREANRLRAHLDELANANPSGLLVVLHHTSKAATNGDGHEINAARGSSVFAGWADVQLNLSHAQGPKDCISLLVLVAKNRDGERGQRVSVRIGLGAGDVAIDDCPQDEDLGHRILGALKEAPGGLTKNGIKTSVRGKRASVLKHVDVLVAHLRSLLPPGPRWYMDGEVKVPKFFWLDVHDGRMQSQDWAFSRKMIAAGVESMTRVPMGASVVGPAMGTGPKSPRQEERYPGIQWSQFKGAEMIAQKYNISRDELDAYAYESHRRAIAATRSRSRACIGTRTAIRTGATSRIRMSSTSKYAASLLAASSLGQVTPVISATRRFES